jgi:hypothetical protein
MHAPTKWRDGNNKNKIRKTKMLNRRSNFVLAAGMTVAIMALAAGSASAAGGNASGKMMLRENVGTRVEGISVQPKPVGIRANPGKVTGIVLPPRKPPINGIVLPPGKVTGIVKPPINGIVLPPGKKPPKGIMIPPVVVNPLPVISVPPAVVSVPSTTEVVTYPRRRYSWYTGGSMAAAQPAMSTAPCNCLTKEYLSDGSVLFKDLCTKEAAILTVEEMKAKAQGANYQSQ